MKPLISVIVPVYNVDKYLTRCTGSIFAQTYDNFELILVDDGSVDSSGMLCDDIAGSDSRVRVIHKQNDGVAYARNTGLDAAVGEYVTFVDADDYVAPDYLEFLYGMIVNGGCEISMCGYCNAYENGKVTNMFSGEKEIRYTPASYALGEIFYGKLSASSCCKMYKRELFDDVRFEKYTLGEDTFTTYRLLLNVKRAAYSNCPKYFYYYRSDSATHITQDYYRFYDYVMLSDYLVDKVPKSDKKLYRAFCSRLVENNFYAYIKLRNLDGCKDEKRHIAENIKRFRTPVLFDKKAQKRTRIASMVSLFSMKAVDVVYDLFGKQK